MIIALFPSPRSVLPAPAWPLISRFSSHRVDSPKLTVSGFPFFKKGIILTSLGTVSDWLLLSHVLLLTQ